VEIARGIEQRNAVPVLQSYLKSVGEDGDAVKAAELAKQIEAMELKNPQLLDRIAGIILDEEAHQEP